MVGTAIATAAQNLGYEVIGKSSRELDLTDRHAVFKELEDSNVDALVIAAAKVGGIGANSSFPVDFLSKNLQIQTNLIDGAHSAKIEKLLFLGSSCIYPKFAKQPISEFSLLTGELEPTNEPYAIAKIAGLKLIQAYRNQYDKHWVSAMPTNLYGPFDNFDISTSHVLPALIAKFHAAKVSGSASVSLWGDGSPLREFLHVSDLADACLLLLDKYDGSLPLNIGSGTEVTIRKLAETVASAVNFSGEVHFDQSMPNGTPRKFLDSNLIMQMGWRPKISLEEGILNTYRWYLDNYIKGQNK